MQSHHSQITATLLEQTQKAKNITSNRRLDLLVGAVETATIAGIFGTFLTEASRAFLEKTGRYILFPAAGVLNFVRTGLALNQWRLEKGKNGTKERAVVEAGSSVIVGTAVIGGLAEAPYAKFAPHMFTVMLGSKTLFHAASACYYMGKAAGTADEVGNETEKEHYKQLAKVNGIVTGSLGLSTLATGFVMILSQVDGFAELGIAATAFATFYQLYNAYHMQTPTSTIRIDDVTDEIDEEQEEEADYSVAGTYQPPFVTTVSPTNPTVNMLSPSSPAAIHSLLNIVPNPTAHDDAIDVVVQPVAKPTHATRVPVAQIKNDATHPTTQSSSTENTRTYSRL